MKYYISPGSIACVLHVRIGKDIPECEYAYNYSESTGVEASPATQARYPFISLPLEIRAAINKYFGTIFALPIEKRQDFIDNFMPFSIEAE